MSLFTLPASPASAPSAMFTGDALNERDSQTTPPAPAPAAPSIGDLLAAGSMVVDLDVHLWEGHKHDKAATREVLAQHGADDGVGKFVKMLLEGKHFARLQTLKSRARALHAEMTLPWFDNGGGRLLPSADYDSYCDKMGAIVREFNEEAVPEFVGMYPQRVNEAHRTMGSLFQPSDYPTMAQVARKFKMSYTFFPVPTRNDWRVTLPQAQVDRLVEAHEERMVAQADTMRADLAARIRAVVQHMVDRLGAYDPESGGRLFASTVDNIRELANVLPTLNVLNDPTITATIARLHEVSRFSHETLKASPVTRASVAQKAAAIVDVMDTLL